MSSGGVTVADAAPQLYFCYKCNHNVSITLLPNAELICPSCSSGFLEEVENPNPIPTVDNFQNPLLSAFSEFLGGGGGSESGGDGDGVHYSRRSFTTTSVDPLQDFFVPSFFPSRTGVAPQEPDVFNPFTFLQEYMSSARAGGAEFHIVINGHNSGDPGFHLPGNFGDYFIGPGFEQLIQQLAENDPNRYGTPPASKSAVEALPNIKVDDNLLKSELAQCAVCKDDFERGMEVKQMPCKHVYHSDCLLPWLELHNSCPVCRYELPTDDPDYQSTAGNSAAAGSSSASGTSGGGGGGGGAQAGQRRFNISLNWPFRRGGDGSSSGNNDGESNSGGQQGWGWM